MNTSGYLYQIEHNKHADTAFNEQELCVRLNKGHKQDDGKQEKAKGFTHCR